MSASGLRNLLEVSSEPGPTLKPMLWPMDQVSELPRLLSSLIEMVKTFLQSMSMTPESLSGASHLLSHPPPSATAAGIPFLGSAPFSLLPFLPGLVLFGWCHHSYPAARSRKSFLDPPPSLTYLPFLSPQSLSLTLSSSPNILAKSWKNNVNTEWKLSTY